MKNKEILLKAMLIASEDPTNMREAKESMEKLRKLLVKLDHAVNQELVPSR